MCTSHISSPINLSFYSEHGRMFLAQNPNVFLAKDEQLPLQCFNGDPNDCEFLTGARVTSSSRVVFIYE